MINIHNNDDVNANEFKDFYSIDFDVENGLIDV